MSNIWPKSLSEEAKRWDNESLTLPPVGTHCRLVLEEHDDMPAEHLERNGKEVEIIAHICNGNLAVCVCYDHWARSDVGEWWVAAFNSAAFEPLREPFWPNVGEEEAINNKTCAHCAITFLRPDDAPVPNDCCEQCNDWPEGRMDAIGQNGPIGSHYPEAKTIRHGTSAAEFLSPDSSFAKQSRYQDATGEDWIDEFARTATVDEFRGAMRFTIGKYNRRAGKKDALLSEIRKMEDYCRRWAEYELAIAEVKQ